MISRKPADRFTRPFLALAALLLCLPGNAAEPTEVHRASLQPFLNKYCVDCHGEKKQKSNLRFDTIHWEITDSETAQAWQDILDVLNAGDMPPEDEAQPDDTEFSQVVGILTENISLARRKLAASGGVNPIRRINKREYLNTVKHLFGLNIHESFVPDDIRTEHFDTAGGEQYFDGPLLEQYIRMGTEVAREGFKWSARPYEEASIKRNEAEGAYKENIEYDMTRPKSDSGFYLYRGNRKMDTLGMDLGDDPRGSYRVRLRAGVNDTEFPGRHFLEISENSAVRGQRTPLLGLFHVTGRVENPSTPEVLLPRKTLSSATAPKVTISEVFPPEITNSGRWFPIYLGLMGAKKGKPNVWIDWIEVEGPIYDSKSNFFGELITTENLGTKGKARELLEKFTYEAFRRVRPDTRYIDSLMNYFDLRMADGLSYEEAMGETLGLVLASPGFLYIEEPRITNSEHLDGRAFATRLAYFLWSSPPDEELYALGESRQLFEARELRKQVTRMLADPRADSFYHGFMSQWIELERFEGITVDWQKHLTFNSGVRYSAAREPIEFFKFLIQENLGADHFIDSDFVVADSQLAQFYGLPGEPDFRGFRKITLPPGSDRGGILTQSAFLTMGSNGARTSPVIRGTLILEKFLNNPPPQPPPNVPEIESASAKPVTNRELVDLHRKQRVCASCHDKIDPIGFSLEKFDSVGLWRETELVDKTAVPIEPIGILPSGLSFSGHVELQELLNSREDKLAENLVESLTSYAIGRPVEFADKEHINDVLAAAKEQDFALGDIIVLIAHGRTFRSK